MPVFILPWLLRIAPYAAAAFAIGGGLWYVQHTGYERAIHQQQIRDAQQAQDLQKKLDTLSAHIDAAIAQVDATLAASNQAIDNTAATVRPTIIREISSAPRYTDPNSGISDKLRATLNAARSLSSAPDAASSDSGAVPSAPPAN